MVKTNIRIGLTITFFLVTLAIFFFVARKNSRYSYDVGFPVGHGLQLRKLNQPFEWHKSEGEEEVEATGGEGDSDKNNKTVTHCNNSVRGRAIIADDKGYLCSRDDLLSTGCCNSNSSSTTRYDCSDCHDATGCCKTYERCISCCMDPQKKPVLSSVLEEAKSLKNLLLLSVSNHFELCLAKCRTSSKSVQHENIYVNPSYKHCYKKESKEPP